MSATPKVPPHDAPHDPSPETPRRKTGHPFLRLLGRNPAPAESMPAERAGVSDAGSEGSATAAGTQRSQLGHDDIIAWITPEVYGRTLRIGSPLHDAVRAMLDRRFSQVQVPREHDISDEDDSFVDITNYAPERTITIAVFRAASVSQIDEEQDELIGSSTLKFTGATLIEQVIRLRPDSPLAAAYAQQTVVEIGGFAPRHPENRALLLDIIDAIVAVTCRVAPKYGITTFLMFPRNGFMSLIRAQIDGLLPGYSLAWCPDDVLGWDEGSDTLARFRGLGLRGLGKYPDIYQISAERFAAELEARKALLARRHELAEELNHELPRAMVRARRLIRDEIASRRGESSLPDSGPFGATAPKAAMTPMTPMNGRIVDQVMGLPTDDHTQTTQAHASTATVSQVPAAAATPATGVNFLPFGATAADEAAYLQRVVTEGGSSAQQYKLLAFELLGLEPGMRVLDAGCGKGVDLPTMSEKVGPAGIVIGIDRSSGLIEQAKRVIDEQHLTNTMSLIGDVEHLPFTDGEFDRVRADRAVQYMAHPDVALAELHRVLRRGGTITVIEPDWSAIVVSPADIQGSTDERALQALLAWCRAQPQLAQPRIGRNLHALLQRQGASAWTDPQVHPRMFPFTRWAEFDAVLGFSALATQMQQAQAEDAARVVEWLDAIRAADARGEFYAAVPLFFAVARKA